MFTKIEYIAAYLPKENQIKWENERFRKEITVSQNTEFSRRGEGVWKGEQERKGPKTSLDGTGTVYK